LWKGINERVRFSPSSNVRTTSSTIEAHARTEVCASKALNSTPFCGCSTDTVLCDKTKNIINI